MRRSITRSSIALLTLSAFMAQTALAGTVGPVGGPYVPVYDETTNTNFKEYIDLFNTQMGASAPNGSTDSLRDLIAGADPQGIAAAKCAREDNELVAMAYSETSPWGVASASTTENSGQLPTSVPMGVNPTNPGAGPYIQVNASHSLRCLLEDILEFEKLGVSIQLHKLLKDYIADAQTKQLTNQLRNKVAAANLDWSRSGNVVNDGGITSSAPVFSTNPAASQFNVSNRQLSHITDQAAADPMAGNPVGSLGIAAPWRLDTTASMVNNMRGLVNDPFDWTQSITGQQLTTGANPLFADEYDWTKFNQSFNDPSTLKGGMLTFLETALVPSNNPIGASQLADMAARGRIEREIESTIQRQTSSGFVPATSFAQNPADPYNLAMQFGIDTNPAGQNQQVVTDMSRQGDEQVRDGIALDAIGAPSAMTQSTALNTTGGVLNYDTTPLATSTTEVNLLVKEIYDIIWYGYIGVSYDTAQFAQATTMTIYDNMVFNDQLPSVVVPDQIPQSNSVGTDSFIDSYSSSWGGLGDWLSWFD